MPAENLACDSHFFIPKPFGLDLSSVDAFFLIRFESL